MNQWTRLVLLASTLATTSLAQEVGIDICACQPSVYEITLDFDLVCDDTDVAGPGINDTACLISSRLPDTVNVTDFTPVQVNEVQILELDQNQDVVGQSVYTDGPYFNGDKLYYTSLVRKEPDAINPVSLPRGIQVSINGNNALNQPLLNSWGILYDNDCGVFPLLEVGEKIGWSVFTDLGDPPLKFCPIAPPTMFPTSAPSEPMTSPTTDSPVAAPPSTSAPVASSPPPEAPTCPPAGKPKATYNSSDSTKGAYPSSSKPQSKSMPKKKEKKDSYYGKMSKMPKGGSKSGKAGGKAGGGKAGAKMGKISSGKAGKGSSSSSTSSSSDNMMAGKGGGKGGSSMYNNTYNNSADDNNSNSTSPDDEGRMLATGNKPYDDECPEP